jgi:hypothetical protein
MIVWETIDHGFDMRIAVTKRRLLAVGSNRT